MQSELEILFSEAGPLVEVFMPSDRETGRPRGFAFVEFHDEQAVEEAIRKFDGYELRGRHLKVNKAEEKQRRSPRFADSGGYTGNYNPRPSKPKGSRRNIRARKRGY